MSTGRFAPSPSASLHLGNLRTALLAWCFARSDGGRFLVRMEDLSTGAAATAEKEQLDDLARIGLDHDGAVVRQSDRGALYADALASLTGAGLTYPCFCSRRDVREAAVAAHGELPEGSYPGTCAGLDEDEQRARIGRGMPPAIRLRAHAAEIEVRDELRGSVRRTVDDFVLRRADGVAAYNLAVVVDDYDQQVDQVVRADDLLPGTPRQVLLQRLLAMRTPRYAHVPLVLGPDGRRLAKRHGAVTLRDRLDAGSSVEDVIGLLAWSCGLADAGESLEARQVLARFDPLALSSEPWVYRGAGPVRERG